MAFRTNILHKMVNVNFTINEVDRTFTVEPLHHWHPTGKGYFYIWSPRQNQGQDMQDGFMQQLHKVQDNGQPYLGVVTLPSGAVGTVYNNNEGLEKPRYLIQVRNPEPHSIPIHPSDIGSPGSPNIHQATHPTPFGENPWVPPFQSQQDPVTGGWQPGQPHEHYSSSVVRGDHGHDARAGNAWNWLYRYEWVEQGIEMVDTIISARGVGGLGSKYHRYTGWGQPIGRCGGYTYPVAQNSIEFANGGESLLVSDITEYSVTCGGETKNRQDLVQDPQNGVGDEYKEGIKITRPDINKNGVYYYRNKHRMHYPPGWLEQPLAATHASALSTQNVNYAMMWLWTVMTNNWNGLLSPGGGTFPGTIPGSAGQQHNEVYYNWFPERYNISQIARSNVSAWDRIDKIENETGVEFLNYRHSLRQKVDDNTINPNTGILQPVTFLWEHVLVDRQTPHSSTEEGHYPEPNNPGIGRGYLMDVTDLAVTAVNIGPAVPANHAFAQNHPAYGEFTSHIMGTVRKSTTLDICGAPQVGIDNPEYTNQNSNWRNHMFDGRLVGGPYSQFWGPHVHGVGGSNFSSSKDGGRGSVARFMSSCKRPWIGDELRNSSLIGNQQANPENWPDITHSGSRPDYTTQPGSKYLGGDSWKWDGYNGDGYTTTSTHPTTAQGQANPSAWPVNWPRQGNYQRNWIGHMMNASSPYHMNGYNIPMNWNVNNLRPQSWGLMNTPWVPNDVNTDLMQLNLWSVGCTGGQCIHFGGQSRYSLPSIKELDSPSYFNHIVTFEEIEDGEMDYGHGNAKHPEGYDCVNHVHTGNPHCIPHPTGTGTTGTYPTYTSCYQHCDPYGTI
tara:strand:- start:328 stop:2838 length:2511 start_codon:yes stop_codon:yes gene_type:complete